MLNKKNRMFWIAAAAAAVLAVMAVCFLTSSKEDHPADLRFDDDRDEIQMSVFDRLLISPQLYKSYPAYFGLDASNGLDLYVWQMAENSYSFGLLPHTAAGRDWLSSELLELKGTNAAQMRQILAAYQIDENDITIIPWQNPISSYIAELWIISDDKSPEEKQKDYIASVRNMLFAEQIDPPDRSDPTFNSFVFYETGAGTDK